MYFNTIIRLTLYIVLVAMNWVDYDTTRFMVERDGIQVEDNPLMSWVTAMFGGVVSILYCKIVALVALLFVWWRIQFRWIGFVVTIYLGVALTNTWYILHNVNLI